MDGSDSGSDELHLGGQGDLASRTLVLESKRFYLDLKENARGRFLKVSLTFTRGYSRFQVFIPAEGMDEFQQNRIIQFSV